VSPSELALSTDNGVPAINGTPRTPGTPLLAEDARWYAIRTRSRHEKVVVRQLEGLGIETFLPLDTRMHLWKDRRAQVELPVFPGYAFVRVVYSPEQRMRVLRAHGVVEFVGTRGKATLIPDKQIDDVKTLLNSKAAFKNNPKVQVGQRVRVRGGSLDGVEGIFVARRGQRRLMIFIEPIQRSLSVDLEGYDVEPV